MPYDVHFCMMASDAELAGLSKLPEVVSWRLFQSVDGSHYRVDFVRDVVSEREDAQPDWESFPENTGISLWFEPRDTILNDAFRVLLKEKCGNAASRPTAQFALMLGRAVHARVLCATANDDGVDVAVSVVGDELEQWSFVGHGEEVSIDGTGKIVRMLLNPNGQRMLHALAGREVKEHLGRIPPFMTTFDPKPEPGLYRLIDRRLGTDMSVVRERRKAKAKWNTENPNPKKLASMDRRMKSYRQGKPYDYSKVSIELSVFTKIKRLFGFR